MSKKQPSSRNNTNKPSTNGESRVKSSQIGTYKKSDASKSTGSGTGPKKRE